MSKPTPTNNDERRKNSGRKIEIHGEKANRVNLSLDRKTLDMLLVLGNGNVSRGVRHASRVAYEQYQAS